MASKKTTAKKTTSTGTALAETAVIPQAEEAAVAAQPETAPKSAPASENPEIAALQDMMAKVVKDLNAMSLCPQKLHVNQ